MRLIFILIFAASILLAAQTQPANWVPQDANLADFPVWGQGVVPMSQFSRPYLQHKVLENDLLVHNHFRKDGSWRLQKLPKGDVVLVDKDGIPRYRQACMNRIVPVKDCSSCHAMTNANTSGKNGDSKISSKKSTFVPGAWSRFWDNASKAWDKMWAGIGSLLGFLIPMLLALLLLLLSAGLLYLLARAIRDWWTRRQNPPPPVAPNPVAPVPAVPPAPAPLVAPVPPPAPPAGGAAAAVAPAPAPLAQQPFPGHRVIITLGDGQNATRFQAGADINRIEYNRDPNDGSTTIRIFDR